MTKWTLSVAAEFAGITAEQAQRAIASAFRSLHKTALVDPKGLTAVALEAYASLGPESCFHLFGLMEIERTRQEHEIPWGETLRRIDPAILRYGSVVDHWVHDDSSSAHSGDASPKKAETLQSLVDFVRENRRICPMPRKWDELWKMLPGRRRNSEGGWDPPLPLILGAWGLLALPKMLRLQEHIEYAADHGVLTKVDAFLRNLREEDWDHV